MVIGYVDEPMDGHRGPPLCLWSQEFYETDRSRGFVRGYNFQFNRTIGIGTEAVSAEVNGLVPWGEGHHDAFRSLVGHRMSVGICTEDLPEEHNRVTLDPALKDRHGIPAPRIATPSARTPSACSTSRSIAAKRCSTPPAPGMSTHPPRRLGGWHLLGTARMGDDPERSVVDPWGRSHDVKNLFIVDGSLFVTSAA